MDLNPLWLADASFALNAVLAAILIVRRLDKVDTKGQRLDSYFGRAFIVAVVGGVLVGSILLARGVVHDALVSQATTEQVEPTESIDQTPPTTSTYTFSSDQLEHSRF